MRVSFYQSLRFRLIVSVVVIEVVMLSIMVWNNIDTIFRTHTDRLNETSNNLITQFATTAGSYLIQVDYSSLEEYSKKVLQYREIAYIIVNDRRQRPVVVLGQDMGKKMPLQDKHPAFVDDNIFDIATDIVVAGRRQGKVLIGFSLDLMNETIESARNRSILIATIEVLLSIMVTVFLGLHLTRNLRYLSEAAAKVGEGKLNTVLKVRSQDEVGVTVIAFNKMVDAIASDQERLKEQSEKLEEQVKKRTAELTAVNKELESFSYSVSHDLRAPLRSIDGFSHALLEDYMSVLDDSGKELLRRVRRSTQRMGQLIDDMLQLSKVTRSKFTWSKVDISEIANNVAKKLRDENPKRTVDIRIAPKMITMGDERLLYIVLENLIGNAWKYTSKKDNACIEVKLSEENGQQTFSVRDNGAGFDMRYVHKLFNAFQRLHNESEFEGTGVGLATVLRVINRHNGHVWTESETGKGATFYFSLSNEVNNSQFNQF